MAKGLKGYYLIIFLVLTFSCEKQRKNSGESIFSDSAASEKSQGSVEKGIKKAVLLSLTQQILSAVKERDYQKFAGFIHPTLGVRFSPYGYIDTINHMKVTSDRFLQLLDENKKVKWGNYDGTGKDILLSLEEYFDRFVYDVDFLNADQTVVNEVLGEGNSLNNLEKVYQEADFTESYFSGFKEKYEGMDWRSLRLVYIPYEGKPFLVAVVHDQWTI